MKVFYNSLIPFRGFTAINLFGCVFARREFEPVSDRILRHEAIHTAQMREYRQPEAINDSVFAMWASISSTLPNGSGGGRD